MAYVAVVIGLAILFGIHEAVVWIARRTIRRPWAVLFGIVAAYAVLAGFALASLTMYGFPTGASQYVVDEVLPDYDAKTKLEPGDTILEVDHVAVGLPEPTIVSRINAAAGKPVTLSIERGGEAREVTIQPTKAKDSEQWLIGVKTTMKPVREKDSSLAASTAITYPLLATRDAATQLYEMIAGGDAPDAGGPKRILEEFRVTSRPVLDIALLMLLKLGVYAWLALIVIDILRMVRLARAPAMR